MRSKSIIGIFLLINLLSVNVSGIILEDNLKKDSLNLYPKNIRVNQAGYTPNDEHKKAFVTAYGDYQPEEGYIKAYNEFYDRFLSDE